MNIAIIGLGKMGEALAYRAMRAGFNVFGFDVNAEICSAAAQEGVNIVASLADFKDKNINVFWLMVPQGELVDKVIAQLRPLLKKDDIIIDGGNSKFTDSIRRAQELAVQGIYFIDCGTSGGVHGRQNGFCLMVGGDKKAYDRIESLLQSVATDGGCAYVGSSGAGHYVKMVHNGIEYGLMQAYAEGFSLIKNGHFKHEHLDLEKIAGLWNHGSVIRGWLLELIENVMKKDQDLAAIKGSVTSTGMGLWTVEQGYKSDVPVPVIEAALAVREWSEETGGNYATKIVAMLRNQFGGHSVSKK